MGEILRAAGARGCATQSFRVEGQGLRVEGVGDVGLRGLDGLEV